MDRLERLRAHQSATNVRLVSDDEQQIARRLQRLERRGSVGLDLQFIHGARRRRLAIPHDDAVQNAVAIQEDRAAPLLNVQSLKPAALASS